MKRSRLLEYRIKRLERLMYEDAIDDELDSMADKINKDYKPDDGNSDVIKDTENIADNMLDNEDDYFNNQESKKFTYNTINDFLDHEIMDIKLNPQSPTKARGVVEYLESFMSDLSHKIDSLDLVRKFQKFIKEINKVNVLVAQQKLVNAIRKRIKIEKQEEDTLRNNHLDHWYEFLRNLKADLKDEIKRCTGINCKVSYTSDQRVEYFKDLLSAEFTISDKVHKDRVLVFQIWEHAHPRWDFEHLYDVDTKKHWLELYKIDEYDVAKQIVKEICQKYDFSTGNFYPGYR